MEVIHTAFRVTDLDRSKEFYIDGLGFDEKWGFVEDGVEHVYVGPKTGSDIHIFEDPSNDAPVEASSGNNIHADHSVCLLVDEDLQERFETLVARTNCHVILEPKTIDLGTHRNTITFVADPDGHAIELIERLEGPPPE
ncbi:VOC family protein [Natronorubrum halophilum]|uniref:VOC family protein n=1 Tax=Natronorubrum halophilum TaxID=1702106 RepID=UPI000EF6D49C|nr:VOC family protein [Natronorubrum halophilum]